MKPRRALPSRPLLPRARTFLCSWLAVTSFVGGGVIPSARAETGTERVESVALFEKGLSEYRAGNFTNAIILFEKSEQLDPGINGVLYLAESYRQIGRVGSAWSAFKRAAEMARKVGDKREKIANEKADEVLPDVPMLTITVPPEARVPGLTVTRDGKPLDAPRWNVAEPVDPGEHVVVTRAPGAADVTARVVATKGARAELRVETPMSTAQAPATTVSAEGPPGQPPPPPAPPAAAPDAAAAGIPWRTVGGVAAALGVVGAGIGAGLMASAASSARDARNDAQFDDAESRHRTGTAVLAGGGVLLVAGGALFLFAPRSRDANAAGLRFVAPVVGARFGGLALGATF